MSRIPLLRSFAVALAPLVLLASGCGVELNAEQETTEIFKDVTVTNALGEPELEAGQEIRLHIDYTQPYPRDLDAQCDLLDAAGTTKVQDLAVQVIPANPIENIPTDIVKNYKDEVTPSSGTLELTSFAPAEAGTYMINCFTQEDENNEVERTITVSAALVE